MKICFVGTFPPSWRQLNEYSFHIAKELQRDPLLSLTIISDQLDEPAPELPGFDVVRVWKFNDWKNPFKILKAIRDSKELKDDTAKALRDALTEFGKTFA